MKHPIFSYLHFSCFSDISQISGKQITSSTKLYEFARGMRSPWALRSLVSIGHHLQNQRTALQGDQRLFDPGRKRPAFDQRRLALTL